MKAQSGLNGVNPREFLEKHWQKTPVFFSSALSENQPHHQGLLELDADEIAGCALDESITSRLLKEGEVWSLEQGPFTEEELSTLPDTGWTLLVQALEQIHPDVYRLLQDFRFLPSWRTEDVMISLSPEGASVGEHFDYYDVFLIQVQGSKRWRLGQACDESTPLVPNQPIKLLTDFQAKATYDCQPGDVLYVPPGIAHHGVTTSEMSLTLSVGFRSPDVSEVAEAISKFAEGQKGVRYQDPSEPLLNQSAWCTPNAQEGFKQLIQHWLDQPENLQALMGQLFSEPLYPPAPVESEDLDGISPSDFQADMLWQKAPEARMMVFSEDGETIDAVYLNGHELQTPESAWPLAWIVANQTEWAHAELCDLVRNQPDVWRWYLDLMAVGVVYPLEED